jgi:hypothetical protein
MPEVSLALSDELTSRNEHLSAQNNELKKKLEDFQVNALQKDVTVKILTAEVGRLERENTQLKKDVESLRVAKEEMMANPVSRSKRTAKGRKDLFEDVGEEYIGLALFIDKTIPKWCAKEVLELQHYGTGCLREWRLRGEMVESRGVLCNVNSTQDRMVAPYPPLLVAKQGRMYTASTEGEGDALAMIVEEELKRDVWRHLRSSEEEKEKTVEKLSSNKLLKQQMRRTISEIISYSKRAARDTLLSILGYDKLTSKVIAKTESEKRIKDLQVDVLKKKLMRCSEKSSERTPELFDMQMDWWRRCQDVRELHFEDCSNRASEGRPATSDTLSIDMRDQVEGVGEEISAVADSTVGEGNVRVDNVNVDSAASPVGGVDMEDPGEFHRLFRNEMSRTVWKTFKRAIQEKKAELGSEVDGEDDMECSILLLARLDAWIMTVIHCMGYERNRGGQRQRMFMEVFEKVLPIATAQLTKGIYEFVDDWEPGDLVVPELQSSIDGGCGTEAMLGEIFSKTYKACVPVYVPSLRKTYIAVKTEWFKEFIGTELGEVKDCYIAEYDEEYKELNVISFRHNTGTGMQYSSVEGLGV